MKGRRIGSRYNHHPARHRIQKTLHPKTHHHPQTSRLLVAAEMGYPKRKTAPGNPAIPIIKKGKKGEKKYKKQGKKKKRLIRPQVLSTMSLFES